MTVGASEIYAVTSLLVFEGLADPTREALMICAYPRKRRGPKPLASLGQPRLEEPLGSSTASPQAAALMIQWFKLSLAGALPVFNDRHMQDRLDWLIDNLDARVTA